MGSGEQRLPRCGHEHRHPHGHEQTSGGDHGTAPGAAACSLPRPPQLALPPLADLHDRVHVVALPMRVPFRGITSREVMVFAGPAGWGEFGPFPEYGPVESAAWLASAIEMAWQGPPPALRTEVPVNATVPAVPATQVPEVLSRFSGCRTVKVKVAERGSSVAQSLDDDIARVRAVCAAIPGATVRCDANGAWTVTEALAASRALAIAITEAGGNLEYLEQPCASVPELVHLRGALAREFESGALPVAVPIAADESIRRAEDPYLVAHAGGADRAVVKAPPLGGPRRLLEVAAHLAALNMTVTVSSALDSAVGMAAGLAAAAALEVPAGQSQIPACGLGTGGFFLADIAEVPQVRDGMLPVAPRVPDPDRLSELAVPPERRQWWFERLAQCHAALAATV